MFQWRGGKVAIEGKGIVMPKREHSFGERRTSHAFFGKKGGEGENACEGGGGGGGGGGN